MGSIWLFDDPIKEFFDVQCDDDGKCNVLNAQTMPSLAPKIQELEENSNFHDALEDLPAKEIHSHAIHLDIDHSKGIFVHSAEVDHHLDQLNYDELDDLEGAEELAHCNNLFGQSPDAKDLPWVSQKLHRAQPSAIDYQRLAPHFAC